MAHQQGKENPAFQGDTKQKETADPNDVERMDMTKKELYPNGHVVGEDEPFVLQKREFDSEKNSAFARGTMRAQNAVITTYTDNKRMIWILIGVALLILYLVYFAFAMRYEFGDEGSIRLLVCTIVGAVILVMTLTKQYWAFIWDKVDDFLTLAKYRKPRTIIRVSLYVISVVATVTLIVVLVALDDPRNLLSLAGLAGFMLILFVSSYSPAMVQWHPVFWGFSLQFYFACMILKTQWGYDTFDWLGDRITEFLSYSNAGAKFVFNDYSSFITTTGTKIEFLNAYEIHFFAFKIMPVITFFSTIISMLYYLGVMQAIIKVIGRFLSFALGTTPGESLVAAGNIFVAMTESPLMIRPFIARMTNSEIHAVMTAGFATIAGSVLGAYISFGVPADHLLSASVMSAPAALAISKLTYPEVEVPILTDKDYKTTEKVEEQNLVEAACNGASMSAKIIAYVIVNVIAFLSLLKFVNSTLIWIGDRIGKDHMTFEWICSYAMYPIALFMGTDPDDCRRVAALVGVKTFTNEFIAYQRLAVYVKNHEVFDNYVAQNGAWYKSGDDIILDNNVTTVKLEGGILKNRSELIATYALCGFSNFGSMGILLGTLGAMAPNRRSDMSKIILRAMIAGNVACFCTACIAGLFYEEFD